MIQEQKLILRSRIRCLNPYDCIHKWILLGWCEILANTKAHMVLPKLKFRLIHFPLLFFSCSVLFRVNFCDLAEVGVVELGLELWDIDNTSQGRNQAMECFCMGFSRWKNIPWLMLIRSPWSPPGRWLHFQGKSRAFPQYSKVTWASFGHHNGRWPLPNWAQGSSLTAWLAIPYSGTYQFSESLSLDFGKWVFWSGCHTFVGWPFLTQSLHTFLKPLSQASASSTKERIGEKRPQSKFDFLFSLTLHFPSPYE